MAALEHLQVDVGKQFDPRVYEALVRVIERRMAARSSASARR